MGFDLPKMAVPYDGPAVARLMTAKSYFDALQDSHEVQIAWPPADGRWFGNARYCESSLTPNGEMFGSVRHPEIDGFKYYEGVWVREYYTTQTAVLIFFPYPGVKRPKPLVYTIGPFEKEWVENVVDSYIREIRNRAE